MISWKNKRQIADMDPNDVKENICQDVNIKKETTLFDDHCVQE